MTRISGAESNTYFYCMDGNGNVVDMVDAEGNNVAHYEYGPFGETLVATGPMAQINPFRFSSKYFDNETLNSLKELTQFDASIVVWDDPSQDCWNGREGRVADRRVVFVPSCRLA